jgi:multidrug resistance efflux pump
MSDRPIAVPFALLLRRAQYQIVPILTMILCIVLAGWLWTRSTRSPLAFGEVNVVRVLLESKIEGMLEELPHPVRVFDTVKSGQVIARLDLELLQKQLERLNAEVEALNASMPATQPGGLLIAEREAQMAELRARLNARDIKSPIDGTVMEIFQRPGQSTVLAKPIMTIAADKGDFIIGYIRENQGIRPAPGMSVTVRTRGQSRKSLESTVASVAPQYEQLPDRHLRNPDFPEWALPVQITLPAEADLKPGELVDLIFHAK